MSSKAKVNKKPQKSYGQQFDELFKSLCSSRAKYTTWDDCMHLWAYSIANGCDYRQDRESKYLAIISKYTKDEVDKITQLFALLVMVLEENREQDFLGQLYMDYAFGDNKKGEYFTPYNVASMMGRIVGSNQDEERGYVTVADHTCGSGAMLIAYINSLIEDGHSPHTKALIVGVDSNPCIAMMCYIQLSLLGAAGYVCVRNSLTEPLTGNALHPPEDAFVAPMLVLQPIWQFRKLIGRT